MWLAQPSTSPGLIFTFLCQLGWHENWLASYYALEPEALRSEAYSLLCIASSGLLSFLFSCFCFRFTFYYLVVTPKSGSPFCDSYSYWFHASFSEERIRELGAKGEGYELMNSFLVNPGILALQYPCPGGSSWTTSRCCPLPRSKHRMWLLPWFLPWKGTVSSARKEENDSGVVSFSKISPYFTLFFCFFEL